MPRCYQKEMRFETRAYVIQKTQTRTERTWVQRRKKNIYNRNRLQFVSYRLTNNNIGKESARLVYTVVKTWLSQPKLCAWSCDDRQSAARGRGGSWGGKIMSKLHRDGRDASKIKKPNNNNNNGDSKVH